MTRAAWPHLLREVKSSSTLSGLARTLAPRNSPSAVRSMSPSSISPRPWLILAVKDGVRVNAINPGIDRDRALFARTIERTMQNRSCTRDAAIAYLLSSWGTTRVGRPDEIGAMTAFVASGRADYLQGSDHRHRWRGHALTLIGRHRHGIRTGTNHRAAGGFRGQRRHIALARCGSP